MSHTRFPMGFTRGRGVFSLSAEAFRLWVSAMDHAREQLTDGALKPVDLDIIPRCPVGKARRDVIDELVRAELWEETASGWQIVNFLDWQDSADVVKRKQTAARERMRRIRAGSGERSQPVRANESRTSREVAPTFSDLPPRPDLAEDSDPDSDARAEDGEDDAPSGPQRIVRNLADALLLAVQERAELVLNRPDLGQWVEPQKWPEVVAIAEKLHSAAGLRPAKLGQYSRDRGVQAVVGLLADGHSVEELLEFVGEVVKTDWWRKSPKGLSSLTPEVVRRGIMPPGLLEHAARKGVEPEALDRPERVVFKTRKVDAAPPGTAAAETAKLLASITGGRP